MSSGLEFLQNLQDLVENHEIIQIKNERSQVIENLQKEIEKLTENLEYILQPFWQQIKNEMFDLKNHIKEQNEQFQQLKSEYQKQTKNLENAQNQLNTIKNAWYNQSAYITTLSSTFGTLLWKASKEANVVHCITAGNKLSELLRIITNSVRTFFEIYGDKLPDSKSDEKQFIITFVGIISNIAASVEGRKILVNSDEGKEFINEILKALPRVSSNEIVLQKIMLVTLYNISIDDTGLSLIENDQNLLEKLVYNITNHNELRQASMKVLESITYETKNKNLINFLSSAIPFAKLQETNDKGSLQLQELVNKIQRNIQYATVDFNK